MISEKLEQIQATCSAQYVLDLEAEVRRLRADLKQIASMDAEDRINEAHEVATAALGGNHGQQR